MCVAVFKPAGADTPSLAVLKDCWDKNPDGAGLAISERQTVFYRKGFMKFADFEDFYYANNLPGRTGQAMVFHFRICTHGQKDAGNTHPFCLSDDPVILRTLTGRVTSVVAHNGVFRDEPKLPKISDTGQFIVNCVTESGGDPVAHWNKHPETVGWSKLVVLYPANRFKLLGSWSLESGESCGCIFSNMHWKPYVAPKGGYFSGAAYGHYYDADDYDDPCMGAMVPAVQKYNRGKTMEKCKACEGTGLSSTGRVRCAACNGTGYVWVQAKEEPAAKEPEPAMSKQQTIAGAAREAFASAHGRQCREVKVWSKERKDFVIVGGK